MKISSPPLNISTVREMYSLWETAFGADVEPDLAPSVLAGKEKAFNDVKVYSELMAGSMVATAVSVSPLPLRSIGAIGEVATHPDSRNKGLATDLCRQVVEDFRRNEGEALFLGTENPHAARIYERLGWEYVPNTRLMVNLMKEETAQEFLERYFWRLTPVDVRIGQAVSRIPVIPLVIVPHHWAILDANTSIISTRIEKQSSCLRLYNRYQRLREKSQGEWFSLVTKDQKILGLSSAIKLAKRSYQVDGFCHAAYAEHFDRLIEHVINWCVDDGAARITMKLSQDDYEKKERVKILGFKETTCAGVFQSGDEKKDAVFYVYR